MRRGEAAAGVGGAAMRRGQAAEGDGAAARRTDVLLLSLGTTAGLRAGDETLARTLAQEGVSVELARVRIGAAGALRRAYPAIDIVEALAARRALISALARTRPRAVIISTTTAALMAPPLRVPYAVRLDAPARLNRPGARNALQHTLERRRLRNARLVLPYSDAGAAALPAGAAPAVVVPQPIEPSGPDKGQAIGASMREPRWAPAPDLRRSSGAHEPREPLAVAYTPDPKAKGLDIVVAAWAQAGLEGAKLEVYGITAERAQAHLARAAIPEPRGVVWRGRVPPAQFRGALRRAQVFLTGARWEDFGFAQLEALADGALLVCGATGGAFEALTYARELSPQLCAKDLKPTSLANALRLAFQMPAAEVERYRLAAAQRVAPYRPERIRATVAERVLPALLG